MAFDKVAFGKKLASLRVQAGLSQYAAGRMLDVSDKAVSKWENGGSFPSMESIVKIADLYGISIADLFKAAERSDKRIVTAVLTGGPCAGKSTAISWIMADMQRKGWKVIFVPEVATELINAGITGTTCGSGATFQAAVFNMQAAKEEQYIAMAKSLSAPKVLIVFDRGLMDGKAFISNVEFQSILRQAGLTEVQARDRYDAVFHLVTAAKGAREHYTTANNAARSETPEQAASQDDRIIEAWTGHPHLRIIGNEGSFETKMKALLAEVANIVGTPGPTQLQRKFLIEMPDLTALKNNPNCTHIEISQTYLVSDKDHETRVRQRGSNGDYLYTKTVKALQEDEAQVRHIVHEHRLTESEYLVELMDADPSLSPIRKDRYCLCENERCLQVDVFPFWNDRALLEYPLAHEDAPVIIPKQFKVIEEVTANPAYRNHELARAIAAAAAPLNQ